MTINLWEKTQHCGPAWARVIWEEIRAVISKCQQQRFASETDAALLATIPDAENVPAPLEGFRVVDSKQTLTQQMHHTHVLTKQVD